MSANNQSSNYPNLEVKISEKKIEHLDDTKPHYYIEITSETDFEFDFLIFKNFYTHMINIVQFANDKWKCVLNDYILMNDPECDEEGEKYFVIHQKQLNENGFTKEAKLIRIYLTQEISCWKNFVLKGIKFLKENNSECENSIKYDQNNSRFEFNYINNISSITNKTNYSTISPLIILSDKEEINQKYIEIAKSNNLSNNLTIFK